MSNANTWILGLVLMLALGAGLFGYLISSEDSRTPALPSRDLPTPPGERAPILREPASPIKTTPLPVPSAEIPKMVAMAALDRAPGELLLQGRLRNSSGRAVAGAEVLLIESSSGGLLTISDHVVRARQSSDARGNFVFEKILFVGERYALGISHAAYAPRTIEGIDPLNPPSLHQDIILLDGGTIRGLVIGGQRQPLAGATVSVYDMSPRHDAPLGALEREVVTDESGRYEALHVAPGRKRVLVRMASMGSTVRAPIPVNPGQAVEGINFVLAGGGVVAGEVLDSDTGAPLQGVLVFAQPLVHHGPVRSEPGSQVAVLPPVQPASLQSAGELVNTGVDGRFRLDGLVPGRYVVNAQAGGYGKGPSVNAETGDENLVIRLRCRSVVSGRVVDESGAPVTTFSVLVSRVPRPSRVPGNQRQSFESPRGEFALLDVEPGSHFLLAEGRGFARGGAVGVKVGFGERVDGIVIRLARSTHLVGRVLDPRGSGVPGVSVALLQELDPKDFPFPDSLRAGAESMCQDAVTLEDGSYVFPNVWPGRFRIRTQHAEFARRDSDTVTVGGGGGDRLLVPDIRLPAASRLRGRVLDRDDRGDPQATVLIWPVGRDGRQRNAHTDEHGWFEIGGLEPGVWQIRVVVRSGRGYVPPRPGADASGDLMTTSLEAGQVKIISLKER